MLCDISNVYPSNGVAIDAETDCIFQFTFYGDYARQVDTRIYRMDTGKQLDNYHSEYGYFTDGYYNGEVVTTTIPVASFLDNNTQYMWKARIYNKDVNSATGKYPDILVTKGLIAKKPLLKTKVVEMSSEYNYPENTSIAIETGLDIKIPSYAIIGEETRKIVFYNDVDGVIGIDKRFTTNPAVDTEIMINSASDENIEDDDSANIVYISPHTDIIEATGYTAPNDGDTFRRNTFIKINGEYAAIVAHDTTNGILTLETSLSSVPKEGDTYEVYCNYIDSPFYSFETKSIPVLAPSMSLWTDWTTVCFKCNAILSHNPSNVYIKSYHWEIYKTPLGMEDYSLSEKSEEIFSGRMEYMARIIDPAYKYKAKIVATTVNNVVIEQETNIDWFSDTDGIENLYGWFDYDDNKVVLEWDNLIDNTSYIILRTDSSGKTEYLETVIGNTNRYYDYKAVNQETYNYVVIPKTDTTVGKSLSVDVDTNFSHMSLYFLSEVKYDIPDEWISVIRADINCMYGDAQYKIEKAYGIEINAEDIEITHNIKRDIQVGHSGLPLVTVGSDSYDSFPLKFTFGQVSCDNNRETGLFSHTHKDYLVWREYVASGLPVVIKDYMGNIWFGTITEHSPSPNTVEQPCLYDISINFTQTRDISKTRILTD